MRRDTFHHHVTAEDYIVQPHGHMSRTMPGQMDQLERADTHVAGFVGEIHGHRLVEGFGEAINAEELITRLFSETRFGEERGEAATNQRQPGFMMRHSLYIEFVTSDLRLGQWFQLAKAAVMVDMSMCQEDVSKIGGLKSGVFKSGQEILVR